MATTGFWPLKKSLKAGIMYVENPEKTTDTSGLENAISYAANPEKTDRTMYVSAINCPKQRAYDHMMATKQRFGKLGGNMGYHGYQSFPTGEVTPEEAHSIGMETARRMWGDEYEIVVTTHLNTDNLHNHFIVNSVSFKTGRKFENHISDHHRLRDISDAVCLEHGKSVLKDAPFYCTERTAYWIHKNGKLTHRDMLRQDIDRALMMSNHYTAFEYNLKSLGYRYTRDERYKHPAVIAPGWQRAIRLDSLGSRYTPEAIRERLLNNDYEPAQYGARIPRQKNTPLFNMEYELQKLQRMDDISALFYLLTELLKLILGIEDAPLQSPVPLTSELRAEIRRLEQWDKQQQFLYRNDIHSAEELVAFMDNTEAQITELGQERSHISNLIRRPKDEEDMECNKALRRELSVRMKPLREELKIAQQTFAAIPRVKELIEAERQHELTIREKQKERYYE